MHDPSTMYTPLRDLRALLDLLRREGELCEVTAPVNPRLELAEVHRRVIAEEGPALLFKNVIGSDFPVVTNLFGTKRRVDLAFGPRPEELIRRIAGLPHTCLPPTLGRLWAERDLFLSLSQVGFRRLEKPQSPMIVDSPARLESLPILTSWPLDGGPFLTLPLVYTEHPESGIGNLGMYRMQQFDDVTMGLHCQIGKGAGFHLSAAAALKRKLPVTVHLGGPPALILSAVAPLPENVPELLLASLVLGKKLPLVKNPIGSGSYVGGAEFVLVGEVDPHERRMEGPFGDHYGYYSLEHEFPVFHCRGVIRRPDAIYPATVVGKPRQEDFFIGDYLQELLSPLFPHVMPAVRSLWSYGETGYHSLSAAVVQDRYKREVVGSALRILGEGQLSLTKFLLLVDSPMDLKDFRAVLTYILERVDWGTDLYILADTSIDTLDYTGRKFNEGSKAFLLGVGERRRELASTFQGTLPRGFCDAAMFSPGCLVVGGPSFTEDPQAGAALAQGVVAKGIELIILVEQPRAVAASAASFLWSVFTRFSPATDIHARRSFIVNNRCVFEGPMVIDARMKPWYPGEVECDPAIAAAVSARWAEFSIKAPGAPR